EQVELFSSSFQERNLSLTTDVDERAPGLRADRDLIGRVVENLLDNELKYVPAGGAVRVRSVAVDEDWVDLVVEDDGPGIPDADKQRIFDKYSRLTADAKEGRRSSF